MRIRKTDITIFMFGSNNTNEENRLVINVFAFTIHNSTIYTSAGTEIEQNNFFGPVATIMRLITQRDGDLSTLHTSI